MDCSLPGSSVHGVFQARITGLGFSFPPPGDLLDPRIKPVSRASQVNSLSNEPSGKPSNHISEYIFCSLSEPQFPCQEIGIVPCTLMEILGSVCKAPGECLVGAWVLRWSVFSTLCDSMDCSPPGSSVHGIFQARNTGVGCHYCPPGGLPNPGIKPVSSALAGRFFTTEPPGKPSLVDR